MHQADHSTNVINNDQPCTKTRDVHYQCNFVPVELGVSGVDCEGTEKFWDCEGSEGVSDPAKDFVRESPMTLEGLIVDPREGQSVRVVNSLWQGTKGFADFMTI